LDPAVIDRTKFLSALPASKKIDSAKEIDSPRKSTALSVRWRNDSAKHSFSLQSTGT
jgi:hypothetical protein